MKSDNYISKYLFANDTLSELHITMEQIKRDSSDDTKENLAKITNNLLSEQCKSVFTTEEIEKFYETGLSGLNIAVANNAIHKITCDAYKRWHRLSLVSKLFLGFQPSVSGASKWALATQFTKSQRQKLNSLSQQDQDIAMLIYGGLLSIASGRWAERNTLNPPKSH